MGISGEGLKEISEGICARLLKKYLWDFEKNTWIVFWRIPESFSKAILTAIFVIISREVSDGISGRKFGLGTFLKRIQGEVPVGISREAFEEI